MIGNTVSLVLIIGEQIPPWGYNIGRAEVYRATDKVESHLKCWRSFWPWPDSSRWSEIWQAMDIMSHCCQEQVCIFKDYWYMVDWTFWRSFWPWPIFSRSSQMWHVKHNDISCYSYKSQVFMFNHCWDMHIANWKFRRIWPWPNSFRSSQILWNAMDTDIISHCCQ